MASLTRCFNSCKLPDFSVRDTFKCACGDQPYMVPDARASQTWTDHAYWCSGTLAMLAYDGSTQYVWNPYSLGQLRARMGGLDSYLECVSRGGECTAPTDPVFEAQQVSAAWTGGISCPAHRPPGRLTTACHLTPLP